MNSEVLKLIDKAPALSVGGYLSLDDAAATIGLERAQLLRIASAHGLRLWCRLNGVSGHVVADADLERDSSSYGPALRLVPWVMGLIQSACMNGHDSCAYLKDVLTRLPTHKASRINELLPHRWQPTNI